MSGDHTGDRGRPELDRDGVPLPTEPPAELAEVFPPGWATSAAHPQAPSWSSWGGVGSGRWSAGYKRSAPTSASTWRSWPPGGCCGCAFASPSSPPGGELAAVAGELHEHPAALVVLDPLYLAVAGGGASGADLYAMGAVLSIIQAVCQRAGAALVVVVTHRNKAGEGRGAKRISGVGPGAWGRVLASAGVAHRTSSPDGTSTVVLAVEVIGGELADLTFRVRRTVRAEDPADLASPLHYAVEVLPEDPDDLAGRPAAEAVAALGAPGIARRWGDADGRPAGGPYRRRRPPAQGPHHPGGPQRP